MDIVLHGIFGSGEKRRSKIRFAFHLTKAVLQCLDNIRFLFRSHRPNRNRAEKAAFMGIRNIEVMLQAGTPRVLLIKDGYTGRTLVDPSAKLFVPSLDFQYGGGIRALRIYKKLVVKGQLIVISRSSQKPLPFARGSHALLRVPVHLRDDVIFACHSASTSLFAVY